MKQIGNTEEVIAELLKWRDLGYKINSRTLQTENHSLFDRLRRRCGSYEAALRQANIPSFEVACYRKYNKTSILLYILMRKQKGLWLDPNDVVKDEPVGLRVYIAATKIAFWSENNPFRGWPGGVYEAGLDPLEEGIRITCASYIDSIKLKLKIEKPSRPKTQSKQI